MPLKPGDALHNGQFQILGQIGRGGFGFVYCARDTYLNEDVAVKELLPGLVGDELLFKRFLSEAKATIRLRHEGIVGTRQVFPERDNAYIVMDYMPGGSLEDRLRGGPLGVDDSIRIAAQVCEALDYAHRHGIVHCDLKPANILFAADGSARLADFGIAHVSDQALTRSWHTPSGLVAGTLPYMSPEQAAGTRDDPRLDLYALGAILYRMLTGRAYLDFDTRDTPLAHAENIQRIYSQQPQPPGAYRSGIPSWLDQAVLRSLAKAPADRYPSAAALRAALLNRAAAPQPSPSRSAPDATLAAFTLPAEQAADAPSPRPAGRATPAQSRDAAAEGAARPRPVANRPVHARPAHSPALRWLVLAGGALLVLACIVIFAILDKSAPPATRTPSATEPIGALALATAAATDTARPSATSAPTAIPELPTAIPEPTPLGGGGGRIAFASNRIGDSEIYVMNVDGSGQTRLTDNPAVAHNPAWSPDGRLIAFASQRDGVSYIYVVNADGSGLKRLSRDQDDDHAPAWSPDGRRIVLHSYRDDGQGIYVMDADGSNPIRLTDITSGVFEPVWSPDGRQIAFEAMGKDSYDIFVMNSDGSGAVRIDNNATADEFPAWSPDGRRIAFASKRNGSYDIYVMNADGSGQTPLTMHPGADLHPTWSPDGHYIAFSSDRDGNSEIYIMNADGSGLIRLTDNAVGDGSPAWSP